MQGRCQSVEQKDMSNKVVMCASSAYDEKFYFNEVFGGVPQSIKDELRIMSVLFTQEVGGIFMIAFEEDGTLVLETQADEEDILYDEIASGLLVNEIKRTRQELLESLDLFYRIFVLKESIADLIE